MLKSVQKMPITTEDAWHFFSNPKNLVTITPPFLHLQVTNEVHGEEMYPGQIITYKVKPLFGIPLFWMTEITHVQPYKRFVDEQRTGPYALWHHQHHFTPINGGTEMIDIVHYAIPFSVFGRLAHKITVKKQLLQIFNYRYKKVVELFGTWPGEKMFTG